MIGHVIHGISSFILTSPLDSSCWRGRKDKKDGDDSPDGDDDGEKKKCAPVSLTLWPDHAFPRRPNTKNITPKHQTLNPNPRLSAAPHRSFPLTRLA